MLYTFLCSSSVPSSLTAQRQYTYTRSNNAVKKKRNKISSPCKHGFVDKPDAIKTTVCFDPDSVGLIDFAGVWVGLDAFVFV